MWAHVLLLLFAGSVVQIAADCVESPCANGGTCISWNDALYGYNCTCTSAFYGVNCTQSALSSLSYAPEATTVMLLPSDYSFFIPVNATDPQGLPLEVYAQGPDVICAWQLPIVMPFASAPLYVEEDCGALNTYYTDVRQQSFYPASVLAGAGRSITRLSIAVAERPGMPVFNLRIAYAMTTQPVMPAAFVPTTVVWGPSTVLQSSLPAGRYINFPLSTPIHLDDGSNLILELSHDASTYEIGGAAYVRAVGTSLKAYNDDCSFPFDDECLEPFPVNEVLAVRFLSTRVATMTGLDCVLTTSPGLNRTLPLTITTRNGHINTTTTLTLFVGINECGVANGGCAPAALCSKPAESITCTCNAGYTGSGTVCTDVNECATNRGGCVAEATCINAVGSFACRCGMGYTGDGLIACTDVDECAWSSPPCVRGTCSNTAGAYACTCPANYFGVNCTGYVAPPVISATVEPLSVTVYAANLSFVVPINASDPAGLPLQVFVQGSNVVCTPRMFARGEMVEPYSSMAEIVEQQYGVFHTYYTDGRQQALYPESALSGLRGQTITDISVHIQQEPALRIANLRIAYAVTQASSLPVGVFASTPNLVYGPTTLPVSAFVAGGWIKFVLTNPIVYTGGNLILDFSRDDSTFIFGGGAYARAASESLVAWADGALPEPSKRFEVMSVRFGKTSLVLDCTLTMLPPAFLLLPLSVTVGNGYHNATATVSVSIDMNECRTANGGCSAAALCNNTVGSFACACNAGYIGNGVQCTDVDECALGRCAATASCTNTPGSFVCVCYAGFTGNGSVCTDVNECATNRGGCATSANCTNTLGSFQCNCSAGFLGNGIVCTDVNECATNRGGCLSTAACVNSPGAFTCRCNTGYVGDGVTTCTDVDECSSPSPPCVRGNCTNTAGAYACACPGGYSGVNCTLFTGPPVFHAMPEPIPVTVFVGNYSFFVPLNATDPGQLPLQFYGQGDNVVCTSAPVVFTVEPYDFMPEAVERSFGVFNTWYIRGRQQSFYPASALELRREQTITEISVHILQLPGRAVVNLRISYALTQATGLPVDAFASTPNLVYGPTTLPVSSFTAGGWIRLVLSTPIPYTGGNLILDFTRDDVGYTFGGSAFARSMSESLTSYSDTALPAPTKIPEVLSVRFGVRGTGLRCVLTSPPPPLLLLPLLVTAGNGYFNTSTTVTVSIDTNECRTANGGCSTAALCNNTVGSFACSCNAGYIGNGVQCAEVNECATARGGCAAEASCTNTPGSFSCACNLGFAGNGTTCKDVNECAFSPCQFNANCTNLIGSYSCNCNAGYTASGNECRDINECATNRGGCLPTATCVNALGSFSCVCNTGYTGNGAVCTDVDECAWPTTPCVRSNCTNTVGAYLCTCPASYFGPNCTLYAVPPVIHVKPDPITVTVYDVYRFLVPINATDAEHFPVHFFGEGAGVACTERLSVVSVFEPYSAFPENVATHGIFDTGAPLARQQSLYATTALRDSPITEISVHVQEAPGRIMKNFRISYALTQATSLPSSFVSTPDVVYGPANVSNSLFTVGGWFTFNLTTPIYLPYAGANLVLDFSRDDRAWWAGGALFTRPTGESLNARGYDYLDDMPSKSFQVMSVRFGIAVPGLDCVFTSPPPPLLLMPLWVTATNGFYNTSATVTVSVDQNECRVEHGGCSAAAACGNTRGSRTCTCNAGYTGNGIQCTDVDECATNRGGCSSDGTCVNAIGSFACRCNTGYTGNGFGCTDVDECAWPTPPCARGNCVNTAGSYACECPADYFGPNCSVVAPVLSDQSVTVTGASAAGDAVVVPFAVRDLQGLELQFTAQGPAGVSCLVMPVDNTVVPYSVFPDQREQGTGTFSSFKRIVRQQSLYAAGELTQLVGRRIFSIRVHTYEAPGRDLLDFRIAYGIYGSALLPSSSLVPNVTVVYGPATVPRSLFTSSRFLDFPLATPFMYDGGNLLLEFSRADTQFAFNGAAFARRAGQSLKGDADYSSGPYPYDRDYMNIQAFNEVTSVEILSAAWALRCVLDSSLSTPRTVPVTVEAYNGYTSTSAVVTVSVLAPPPPTPPPPSQSSTGTVVEPPAAFLLGLSFWVVIAIGGSVPLCIVLAVCACCCWTRRKRRNKARQLNGLGLQQRASLDSVDLEMNNMEGSSSNLPQQVAGFSRFQKLKDQNNA